jgi:alkanesulfonate monooxygenase SsuD/methylene tetrahydromethanopterin reductase-like flavin-dependent oxidoreductase (luciferase family)
LRKISDRRESAALITSYAAPHCFGCCAATNLEAVRFQDAVLRSTGQLTIADAHRVRVLLAAMGPRMLHLAGTMSDGTLLGWAGPKSVRDYVAPAIRAAAEGAQRPAPRIGTALPVCVTDDFGDAHRLATELFAVYTNLPSYRTILDREGKATVAEVALIGDGGSVGEQLAELAAAGVTDLAPAVYGTPEERDRTMALLSSTRRSE